MGERTVEVLKQGQYIPMDVEDEILILFALTKGYLDDIDVNKLHRFETECLEFFHSAVPAVIEELKKTKDISPELEGKIVSAIDRFKKSFN